MLDTLGMALWSRDRQGVPITAGTVRHNDAGQYTSFAFTSRLIDVGERLAGAGVVDLLGLVEPIAVSPSALS